MDVREYIKMRKCHHSLTTRMDVKAPLVSYLYQDGVISDDNKDLLESKATNAAKASVLLRLMQMTDCNKRSPYPSLLKALAKCDQEFLSEELENCTISTEDILLYKDDLRPFLKREETIESLLKQYEYPQRSNAGGTRRSWPTLSGESVQPKSNVLYRRTVSDAENQCPSIRFSSHSSRLSSSSAAFYLPSGEKSSASFDNATSLRNQMKKTKQSSPVGKGAARKFMYETLQYNEYGSQCSEYSVLTGPTQQTAIYGYTKTITPLDSAKASQSRIYENYPRSGEDVAKEVAPGPVFSKRDCDKYPERKKTLNCPKITKVAWRLKNTWKTQLTALDSTSCVKGNGDIIVYGQTAKRENRISVHELEGKTILAWTPISQSVDGLNALVFSNRVKKQSILAVVSSQQERQIDLYDVNTGQFIRCCSYKELDPGIMCTGPKGQILVVDRSTDPWSIAVLDTDKDDLPVVKKFQSGVRHIWGIRFAEAPDGKIIFASSYLARCLIAIDWKSGNTLWKIPTPTWRPYNICKSVKGCLFVTNIEKQCQEIYVFDYSGNQITILTQPNVRGILDLHCLSNEKDSLLVLGHLENTQRSMSVFKLYIK